MIIETQPYSDQDDLEEIVHEPERDVWEDELVVDQAITLGCLLSMQLHSIDDFDRITRRLSIVRCALAQPKESDDWRRSQYFKLSLK